MCFGSKFKFEMPACLQNICSSTVYLVHLAIVHACKPLSLTVIDRSFWWLCLIAARWASLVLFLSNGNHSIWWITVCLSILRSMLYSLRICKWTCFILSFCAKFSGWRQWIGDNTKGACTWIFILDTITTRRENHLQPPQALFQTNLSQKLTMVLSVIENGEYVYHYFAVCLLRKSCKTPIFRSPTLEKMDTVHNYAVWSLILFHNFAFGTGQTLLSKLCKQQTIVNNHTDKEDGPLPTLHLPVVTQHHSPVSQGLLREVVPLDPPIRTTHVVFWPIYPRHLWQWPRKKV